jgi:UDP-N-acetylmuramyl pentapeptide synthase
VENLHSVKKRIAVSDKKGNTLSILNAILAFCGRENYIAQPVGEPAAENTQPAVLLLCGADDLPSASGFTACVAEYSLSARPEVAEYHPITYSVSSDNADFTARNIRKTPEGLAAFEIIGVGVIGRARLSSPTLEPVGDALAASVAAITAGIPFADVLDALNNIHFEREMLERI